MPYRRIAQLRTPDDFRKHLEDIGATLDFDDEMRAGADAPLSQPVTYKGKTLSNRFAVLPMEGWDANPDGTPSDLTARRWRNFGRSGAKLWLSTTAASRQASRSRGPTANDTTDGQTFAWYSIWRTTS